MTGILEATAFSPWPVRTVVMAGLAVHIAGGSVAIASGFTGLATKRSMPCKVVGVPSRQEISKFSSNLSTAV